MSKTEIAEVVSAVAVVVGLVFVGLELRQNTEIQRVTATQTLVAQYVQALEVMGAGGDTACVYALGINGLDNLDDDDRLRFFVIMFKIFRAAEQLQYYSVEGMVEPRIWRGFERQIHEVVQLPGVQEWWAIRRDWFSDEFQQYLDGLIATGTPRPPQRYQQHSCLPTT